MAIEIRTIQEIQERIINQLILSINAGQTDRTKLVDPNIRNSALGALASSFAAGFDENNDVLRQVLIQLFPTTATGIYLEMWAAWFGITRIAAVKSTGNVLFVGVAGSSIPAGTLIARSDDTQFETQVDAVIALQSISVSSITRTGDVATVTFGNAHGLATGMTVTISGAVETAYNGDFIITATSETTLTYDVAGSPSTPATGTILAGFTAASIGVIASEYGSASNSAGGSQFLLVSPVTGVDTTCYLDYNGLAGGLDTEEDEELRARLLERTSSFTAPYTVSGLPVFIKQKIPGVTRIWVEAATPSPGYTTIYFTRDNDANIIPSSAQALDVKNAIIDEETGIKPANTPDSYVIVSPPTPVSVNITVTGLSPNSVDMIDSIETALIDYFKSPAVAVGVDIDTDDLKALIRSVLDANGNQPTFTLTAPAADVTINDGELAIAGTINIS